MVSKICGPLDLRVGSCSGSSSGMLIMWNNKPTTMIDSIYGVYSVQVMPDFKRKEH